MSPQATKLRILMAAIEAIEKNGIQNITTRVIADEAGVNNAALHYYYGTKEQLLEQALEHTLQHWVEDTDEILAEKTPIQERLEALFDYVIGGVLRYPNLIRAHIQPPIMEGISFSPFLQLLKTWIDLATAGILEAIPDAREDLVRIAIQSAVAAVLVIGLLPEAEGLKTSQSLRDPDSRKVLVAYFVQSILQPATID
ncbi:MAG: TetR/AcrR family transcriptional regulator [Anaerolineales bacterium]|nr:TetR/AcrR family transcriptional regulator [Anaerolineales bacterium]